MSKDDQALQFGPFVRARFLDRPNRFLVICDIDGVGAQECFLPNPGRLWELLFPGTVLYVTDKNDSVSPSSSVRRTQFTVMAVERDGRPIFLHTHLNNSVARFLVQRRLIPELATADVVQAEYTVGHSRFDFLLRDGQDQVYLEVKSCTLFGQRVAMFPDAVTARGRRHLMELASLRRPGIRTCVLFVIHAPDIQWFMPDFHTDLEFSRTLLEVRDKLEIFPVAVEWNADLSLSPMVKRIEIPWDHLHREVDDRGSYLLLLKLDEPTSITIDGLGRIAFPCGFYIYVGAAAENLQKRLARHARRRKTLEWHIDHLRDLTPAPIALPIRGSRCQECDVARDLAGLFQSGPIGFGASDCACDTHLLWHDTDPLQMPAFHKILQRYRMREPV